MKQCSKCKELKPDSEFNKHARHKDGLSPWCKMCRAEYIKNPKIKLQENKRKRENHVKDPRRELLHGAKKRAKYKMFRVV